MCCGRRYENYFKTAQIGTIDKKPFSNLLVSRELFLCAETARKLLLKPNSANTMSLLSTNLKIQYPRNNLIQNKSPIWWKTEPKLFQNYANWNTRQKTVFKPTNMSRESFFSAKTARKLVLKANNANIMPLFSKNLKTQYQRNNPIPYKSPVL